MSSRQLNRIGLGLSASLWLVLGTGVLAMLSVSTIIADLPSPWAPWPTHQILLSLFAEGRFLKFLLPALVVPVLYLATSAILWNARSSGALVLSASSVFLIVNTIYLVGSWPYGVRWQGLSHTISVTALNIVGVSVIAALAWFGFRQGSKHQQRGGVFRIVRDAQLVRVSMVGGIAMSGSPINDRRRSSGKILHRREARL